MKSMFIFCAIMCIFFRSYGHDNVAQSHNDAAFESFIQNEIGVSSHKLANLVFRRYYFIHRLDTTMSVISDVQKRASNQAFKGIPIEKLVDFSDLSTFEHTDIKKSIEAIKKQKNLLPLFMVWHNFKNYKSIEDQLFIEEFTKAVLIISVNLLINTSSSKKIRMSIDTHDFLHRILL